MSETNHEKVEEWDSSDLCYGLLFLVSGVLIGALFVSLLTSEYWPLILVGGWGWLMCPLLIILGVTALWESARALWRRLGE